MEEYPPTLTLIDHSTGINVTKNRNELVEVKEDARGKLNGWQITIHKFLPSAFLIEGEFRSFNSEGSTAAVYIKATNIKTGSTKEGWVGAGSHIQKPIMLSLGDNELLVMAQPESKLFRSELVLSGQNGDEKEAIVEVNRPTTYAGWKIYQASFDQSRGKWSKLSVFDVVRDPWFPAIQVGAVLFLLGMVHMFWTGIVLMSKGYTKE